MVYNMWFIRLVRLFRGICTLQLRFGRRWLKGHEKRKYDNWTKIDCPCIYKTWVCMYALNLFKIRRLGSRKSVTLIIRRPAMTQLDIFLSHPKCHIVTNFCDNRNENRGTKI